MTQTRQTSNGTAQLGRTRTIAYCAGALGMVLAYQCFSTYVQFFYIDVLRLGAGWVGAAMVLYAVWNAVNDPLAGHLSDRTRTRWGRRLPYIAFGGLPLILCFAAVWMPPFSVAQGQAVALFIYFLVIILVFDTLWTFVALNWTALFPEMFPDPDVRARISGWRQFFAIPGLILGIALAPVIYSTLGWPAMGVLFGAISGLAIYLSLWGSREQPEFQRDEPMGFVAAFRTSLTNPSFRLFLITNFVIQFTFVMVPATLPFYVKYVLGLTDLWTSVLMGAMFLAALPCLYLWTHATQRVGARRALMAAITFFAITILLLSTVSGPLMATILFLLIGVGLAGLLMLPDLLIADIVDEDELRTGTRREGIYFGMNGFVVRFAVAIQSLMLTQMLIRGGYVAELSSQPEPVLLGLRLLISVAPFVALLIGLLALRAYPLDGARLVQVRTQVAALHQKKAQIVVTDREVGAT